MRPGHLEITDLLWSFDESGQPEPVARDHVVELLWARGQKRAAGIMACLPVTPGGELDPVGVDALGLRIHGELQRLGEELQRWHRD